MAVDLSAILRRLTIETYPAQGVAFTGAFNNLLYEDPADSLLYGVTKEGAYFSLAAALNTTHSRQGLSSDFTLTGSGLGHAGGYFAGLMANILGGTSIAAVANGNVTAGVIGKYTIGASGYAPGYARAGLYGEAAGPCDAPVMAAVSDGDYVAITVRAMYGVDRLFGGGTTVQVGLDLKSVPHDVYSSALTYSQADIRRPNDICHIQGSGAPTDGASGTGAGVAGPGSDYTDIAAGNRYYNKGTKASPSWKLVTTA